MHILKLSAYSYPEQVSSTHLSKDLTEAYEKAGFTFVNYVPTPSRGISEDVRREYKKKKYEVRDNGHTVIHRFPMFREGKHPIQRAIRYVLVNFEAFANLVDAVGGIELELTTEEVEYVNAYLWEYNILTERPEGTDYMDTSVGGMVHLNGAQALSYSRNRYLGTDFGRTERQRKVLEAVIRKMPKALVTNPKEVISGLVTNLRTNLTQQECFRLCLQAAGALSYDMEQSSIPLEGTYKNATIREMSVLEVDFEANKEFIRKNIYGEEE